MVYYKVLFTNLTLKLFYNLMIIYVISNKSMIDIHNCKFRRVRWFVISNNVLNLHLECNGTTQEF